MKEKAGADAPALARQNEARLSHLVNSGRVGTGAAATGALAPLAQTES